MTEPTDEEKQLADAPAADVVERLKEAAREEQARKDK
jgi:hypothetical protein